MTTFGRVLAAIALFGALATPTFAQELNPEGAWQSTTGEARVKVTLCGDGTQLCAKLVWLSDEAKTEGNLALLNGYVVKGAQHAGENKWKGTVRFDGDTATGSIVQVSDDTMTVSGCKLVCKSFDFHRL